MSARIDSFLKLVYEQKASDLHFVSGSQPIIRHDGELLRIKFRLLTNYETKRFLYEIMTEEQKTHFEKHNDTDCNQHKRHWPEAISRHWTKQMPPTFDLLLVINRGLLLLAAKSIGLFFVREKFQVGRIRAKLSQKLFCAGQLFLIVDPNRPAVGGFVLQLILDSLNVKKIAEGFCRGFIFQMPDLSHE